MFDKIKNDLFAIAILLVLCIIYMYPSLSGEQIYMSDHMNTMGMIKDCQDYKAQHGENPFWTSHAFSGMPTFMLHAPFNGNYFAYILGNLYGLGRAYAPVALMFFCALGFYTLLRTWKVNSWLALAGGIAMAFTTYNVIILEVGHLTKLRSIGLGCFLLASIQLALKGRYWLGAALFGIFLNFSMISNHIQVTYYFFMIIGAWMVYELIQAIKYKTTKNFFTVCAFLAIAAVIGLIPSTTQLLSIKEYTPSTMRGGSELKDATKTAGGLDQDYAFAWSYGKLETLTLMFPNFMGGSSTGDVKPSSAVGKLYMKNGYNEKKLKEVKMPFYWGTQDFTAGPFYFGAFVCFLFIVGMLLIKEKYKWWILAITLLSIMLSWGKNFLPLSEFFFSFVPMYNKFRSVNMLLVIASVTIPLLSFITLQKIISGEFTKEQIWKAIKYAGAGVGALALFILALGSGMIDQSDKIGNEVLTEALNTDRISMMRLDAIRTVIIILLGIGLIWALLNEKIKKNVFYAGMVMLMVADMWSVGKDYLNADDFMPESKIMREFTPRSYEKQILADKDPNFRVVDVTRNFTTDSRTSYFFKNIGGYHGSKSARYQDLITKQLTANNMEVFNMLNTKYFIAGEKGKEPVAQRNPDASGPAWFVKNIQWAADADEEINLLDKSKFKYKDYAVINKKDQSTIGGFAPQYDSTATIKMTSFGNDKMEYESNSATPQFAVFSEIYYQPGWTSKIDGKETPHVQTNYVLRGMAIPAGKHKIEFTMYPPSYKLGLPISKLGSLLLFLLLIAGFYMDAKQKKEQEVQTV